MDSLQGHALHVLYLVLSSLNYLGTGGFMSLVAENLHIRELVQFPRGQTAEDFKVAFCDKGVKYQFRMTWL